MTRPLDGMWDRGDPLVASAGSPAHVALTAARRLLTLGRDHDAFHAFADSHAVPDIDIAALYEGAAQALRNQGLLLQAVRLLDSGLLRFPGHASLRFIRSLMLLGLGQFEEGWHEYELRLKTPQRCYLPRAITWPRWRGPQHVRGGKLLIWLEQGFGDEIMFASLIPLVFPFVHSVTFECSRDTASLFRCSFPNVRICPVELNGAMPEAFQGESFDHECPLGSLPLALGMGATPPSQPWLKTESFTTGSLRMSLENIAAGRRIIGVSWRGGTSMTRSVSRSLSLSQLRPILEQKALFVAIQHDMKPDEEKSWPFPNLIWWPELVTQLNSLASLIAACDEIVTVCNTNVHLAGAMGKPVKVLAPFVPEWRYGFAADAMPWYPDVRIFRQASYGDWNLAIERVVKELRESIAHQ